MPTSLGPAEILVILVVALIVLGPKRLPEAARQVGKTLAEVRKWSQGLQDEVRNVMDPNASPPSYSAPPLPVLPAETAVPPAETAGPVEPVAPAQAVAPPETAATNGRHPDDAVPPAGDPPRD
jgi:sec-independent protein translocase protein TatA